MHPNLLFQHAGSVDPARFPNHSLESGTARRPCGNPSVNHRARKGFPKIRGNLAGFTLIELLTVIAVIGVLAGLLVPVLSTVREQARSVKCLSNVRQIGLAAFLFAQDNEVYVGWESGTDRKELLFPYLDTGRSNRDTVGDQVWHCPNNDRRDREASYGFNTNLNWQPIAAIRNPSRTVALADAGINDAGEPILATHLMPPSATATGNIGRPNPRHRLRGQPAVSVAFADGHARSMTMEPPFYPGLPGEWNGNGVTNPGDADYPDELWDLD